MSLNDPPRRRARRRQPKLLTRSAIITLAGLTVTAVGAASCAKLANLEGSEDESPTAKPASTPANPKPSNRDASSTPSFDAAPDSPIQNTALRCGDQDCLVGRDVCCVDQAAGVAKCVEGDVCPVINVADSGVDAGKAPPPLKCFSYTQCNFQYCCYDPAEGSKCTSNCFFPRISLCMKNDACSFGSSCEPLANPPQKDVKQCR